MVVNPLYGILTHPHNQVTNPYEVLLDGNHEDTTYQTTKHNMSAVNQPFTKH